jgi:hypothetical protein
MPFPGAKFYIILPVIKPDMGLKASQLVQD